MRRFAVLFYILSLAACSQVTQKSTQNKNDFSGEWYSEKLSGQLVIDNCTEKQCDIKMDSGQYGHECNVNEVLNMTGTKVAEIKKHYSNGIYEFNGQIIFVLQQDDVLDIHYGADNRDNIWCGMNATIEGLWKRKI